MSNWRKLVQEEGLAKLLGITPRREKKAKILHDSKAQMKQRAE